MKLAILAVVLVALAARSCSALPPGPKDKVRQGIDRVQYKIGTLANYLDKQNPSTDDIARVVKYYKAELKQMLEILRQADDTAKNGSVMLAEQASGALAAFKDFQVKVKEILKKLRKSGPEDWIKLSGDMESALSSFSNALPTIYNR